MATIHLALPNVVEESDDHICQLVMIQGKQNHWLTKRLMWGVDDTGKYWAEMEIYDSLGGTLVAPIAAEMDHKTRNIAAKLLPSNFDSIAQPYPVRKMPTPQQPNSHDCGICATALA